MPFIIQTDAFQDGLGSLLIKDNHVMSYSSRSFNKAKKQYTHK